MIPTAILFGVAVALLGSLLLRQRAGVYQGGVLLLAAVAWGVAVSVSGKGGIVLGAGGFLVALANAVVGYVVGYGVIALAKRLLQNLANVRQR